MDSTIAVDELSPDEWEAYKALRLEALKLDPQAFGASYVKSLELPDANWRERLVVAAEKRNQWIVFAKEDGKVVGMAGAGVADAPDAADFYSVYVTRAARGRGISKDLMDALLSRIAGHGAVKKLRLTVGRDQAAAVALYAGLGFQTVREEEYTMGDGETYTVLVMHRPFP